METLPIKLSIKSRIALRLVHPDLVSIVNRALEISAYEFCITSGARTLAMQRSWFDLKLADGERSRHIPAFNESGLAEAVDVMPMIDGVAKRQLCGEIATAFFAASRECEVPITWGGQWRGKWRDPQHFELTRGRPRLT